MTNTDPTAVAETAQPAQAECQSATRTARFARGDIVRWHRRGFALDFTGIVCRSHGSVLQVRIRSGHPGAGAVVWVRKEHVAC